MYIFPNISEAQYAHCVMDSHGVKGHLYFSQDVCINCFVNGNETHQTLPAGTWRRNDVMLASMRREDVASTLVWRRYNVMCPLGLDSLLLDQFLAPTCAVIRSGTIKIAVDREFGRKHYQ